MSDSTEPFVPYLLSYQSRPADLTPDVRPFRLVPALPRESSVLFCFACVSWVAHLRLVQAVLIILSSHWI